MLAPFIFISHSSEDDAFVKELRIALEGLGLPVWVDSRNLRGGAKLAPEIREAIEQARQVIAVLSPQTINSAWVRQEIKSAQRLENRRRWWSRWIPKVRKRWCDYRVIPLLLPGIEPGALENWFEDEPVAVSVRVGPGGLDEALPGILAALGERLPVDYQPLQDKAAAPVEELLLSLTDPAIQHQEGTSRVAAMATVCYQLADPASRAVQSKRFSFTAPLGPIEAEELRWYLESYYLWPTGIFQERARRVEAQLPDWGKALYQAVLGTETAQEALRCWQGAERRFSVEVDSDLPEGASPEAQTAAREAASELLALPWELLHDGRTYLFHGAQPVRVRRRLPNRHTQRRAIMTLPIRTLLVSPRPEDEYAGYVDHRLSARPLLDAVENLGRLAELTVLTPPTRPALERALQEAREAGRPFAVVHFDGHGLYDRERGLGGLCFEDPKDEHKLENRAMQIVYADDLAALMRDYRIPLVFLEACQSAKAEEDPTASVAARLLEEGVTSVVAMSHGVLVETARRFVAAFYEELAKGSRVGQAMLTGQRALYGDTYRLKIMGAGELRLHDWFVPVLYQEEQDPQLFTRPLPRDVQQLQAQRSRLALGKLPEPPPHTFIGRSRELLALERLLHQQPYATVRGPGGTGKTTLAVELARWLVRTERFQRAAFVSVEYVSDVRAILDSLGRQLLPDGDKWSVAHYGNDLKQALQPVQRVLSDQLTIIVLDNLESVLPDASGQNAAGFPVDELFQLCRDLLQADERTRLLFTSREPLLDNTLPPVSRHGVQLGALSRDDAVELVSHVLTQHDWQPSPTDPGSTPQEIIDLVDAVNCHARALVLLAPEIARRGVRATTQELHQLMAELDRRSPHDRENSLYASVELSLRRLSPETRERIKVLGVFQGGVYLDVLRFMLNLNSKQVFKIGAELIQVGLAGDIGCYGHLRLDPALPPYLRMQLSEAEQQRAEDVWATGMMGFIKSLSEHFQDPERTVQLTLLELPNLLALLDRQQKTAPAEHLLWLAARLEKLLAPLGRSQALARVQAILDQTAREQSARALGNWNHAQFVEERLSIERQIARGNPSSAHRIAQELLQHCLAAGETAYEDAGYDLATAYFLLGGVLSESGDANTGLPMLAEARQRFQALAKGGNVNDEHNITVIIMAVGSCLRNLGQLDQAAVAFEEAIHQAEEAKNGRVIAHSKFQLGIVRQLQRRYPDALELFQQVRQQFEAWNELDTLTETWDSIGLVYRHTRQFEQAEHAYRQALAIKVQQRDRAGEAVALDNLGTLYDDTNHLEDAVAFYRQAVTIYAELKKSLGEGKTRNNLADTLLKLRRYDDARRELQRTIECKQPYGYAAQPWTTWNILYRLEQATGHPEAAAQARQQAIQCLLDYRHTGGEDELEAGAQICAQVAQAIHQGYSTGLATTLPQFLKPNANLRDKILIPNLKAILDGSRDPALADDPALHYRDAVELRLLLEKLSTR